MKVIRLSPDWEVRAIILYFYFQFSFYQPKQIHRDFFFGCNWIVTWDTHQICAPKGMTTTLMKSEGTDMTVLDTDRGCVVVIVLAYKEARERNQMELFPCLINQCLHQGSYQTKRSRRPLQCLAASQSLISISKTSSRNEDLTEE